MKNIWKILEMLFFAAAGAFLGSNLMNGELFTTKGCILLSVIFLVFILIIVFETRNNRKHIQRVKETGVPKDMEGRVCSPLQQKIAAIILLIAFWLLVLMDIFQLFSDFTLLTNVVVLTAFAIQFGVALSMTLFFIIFYDIIFKKIRFDCYGVTYRKKFYSQSILWQEFGKEKESKNRVTYYDCNGKKLFTIRSIDEGAQEFYMFYKTKTVSK